VRGAARNRSPVQDLRRCASDCQGSGRDTRTRTRTRTRIWVVVEQPRWIGVGSSDLPSGAPPLALALTLQLTLALRLLRARARASRRARFGWSSSRNGLGLGVFALQSQGSSCLATLGFTIVPRWGSSIYVLTRSPTPTSRGRRRTAARELTVASELLINWREAARRKPGQRSIVNTSAPFG